MTFNKTLELIRRLGLDKYKILHIGDRVQATEHNLIVTSGRTGVVVEARYEPHFVKVQLDNEAEPLKMEFAFFCWEQCN